jgi:hypothetical protein
MLSSDTIAINRLQIKGDKCSNQKLVNDFVQTSWAMPLPAHLQQAWVFVRQIKINGKLHGLRQQAAQALDKKLHAAMNVRSSHANQADAIWFDDFPQLLAFLLSDLALGQAAKWYWEKWSYLLKYPRGEAITRLMCEYPEYLVAVVDELIKTENLVIVLKKISSQSALTVAIELSRSFQISDENSEIKTVDNKEDLQIILKTLISLKPLLKCWQSIFNEQEDNNGYKVLAARVIGLKYMPLFLYKNVNNFTKVVTYYFDQDKLFISKYNKENTHIEKIIKDNKLEKNSQLTSVNKFNNDKKMIVTTPTIVKYEYNKISNIILENNNIKKIKKTDAITIHRNNENIIKHNLRDKFNKKDNKFYQKSIEEGHIEPLLDGINFVTQLGGFFYLLNPINRLLTKKFLDNQSSASAWLWLYDLYRLFKIEDKSLELFLLNQLHTEVNSEEINPVSRHLFAQLNTCYAEHSFWLELSNNTNFITTQAQVIATASHIDVYYSLQSTRVDLRLAAFDINPGWLPWLGRVVKFHYLEDSINQPIQQG